MALHCPALEHNITLSEMIEALVLSFMAISAYHSPIRWQALWSVLGFALFLCGCHYALGVWGDGKEAPLFAGVLAHVFAISHLKFRYDNNGLAVGIIFVAIGFVAAIAGLGIIPITVGQGAGFDAWTLITVLLWLSWVVFIKGIYDAKNNSRFFAD